MPRNLARLRYRAPPKPVSFTVLNGPRTQLLEKRVSQYVTRQSNPRHVKIQTVVNHKAKPLATGQSTIRPIKPFTLRDVVDPAATAPHGQIIYVFRNVKTNQVIYSLQELLDNHHLAQLPFIGKHSTPPVLRPDEWLPHCVVTFPTPEQGHNAFRKLREFRKLHELAWDKNNPGWKLLPIKTRISKIMDQRANMSADLAEVLRIQESAGEKMAAAIAEQEDAAKQYMSKKWEQINALADVAAKKEREVDRVKWLEHEIRRLTAKLEMKHKQKEADQAALKAVRETHEIRLRRILYAQRKAEQFNQIQLELAASAAPANAAGSEAKLAELRGQAAALEETLANPDPTRTEAEIALDRELLAKQQADVQALEDAFTAKRQVESRDHYIARSVLPQKLKKALPAPYTLAGVDIRWADMQDALFAAGKWPEAIEHDSLALNASREDVAYLTAEQFAEERMREVGSILQALRPEVAGAAERMRVL
jgi:hypothetical protein